MHSPSYPSPSGAGSLAVSLSLRTAQASQRTVSYANPQSILILNHVTQRSQLQHA